MDTNTLLTKMCTLLRKKSVARNCSRIARNCAELRGRAHNCVQVKSTLALETLGKTKSKCQGVATLQSQRSKKLVSELSEF